MASKATFEVYLDRAGEWRWRLRHQNGNIIATSGEGYKRRVDCIAGIESVHANAVEAPIKELPRLVR